MILSSTLELFLYYIDIPFINGKYIHGEKAFCRLYSNQVEYDDSISFPYISN